jgi:hypothetical protein
MKKSNKKLALNVEHVRVLNDSDLEGVVGGKHTRHCASVLCTTALTCTTR